MLDSKVQAKISSTIGKKAVAIPHVLEEKIKKMSVSSAEFIGARKAREARESGAA